MNARVTRRDFINTAMALGASAAFARSSSARPSKIKWSERRDLFAEGVASGDPDPRSALLWTRVSNGGTSPEVALTVEVAKDAGFREVVAEAPARALLAADHTCRVLVGGLEPSTIYWYRFTLADGSGSRVGRTRTAARDDDPRPVSFAFVSCQNIVEGSQHAYRRMKFEDEARPAADQLAFVLHLGDFVYEVVDYPEDSKDGHRYDRRLRDVIRYKNGEKVANAFHVPTTLEDYRTLYRAYLHDPDIQDARAHWPFVNIWDNHEFSWMGFQSFQRFEGKLRPAQTMKVAANQTWFEYQPARVKQRTSTSIEAFDAPAVRIAPIETFDANGIGTEPNNLAAIESLKVYRTLRWGRHFELILTDQYSHRSESPGSRKEAEALGVSEFPYLYPQEAMEALDAGKAHQDGHPADTIFMGETTVPNFRKNESPQTLLGIEQKAWFIDRLTNSRATWKVWGNSLGSLEWRADPQNLPKGMTKEWPGRTFAGFGGGGDWGSAFTERGEIYDAVKAANVTGFVTVSGDRHSFWAGLSARALPPKAFEPVGAAFITGSICSPGLVESLEHNFPRNHPLRALFLPEVGGKLQPTVNLLLHHGVRSCLEYARTGDATAARRVSNPDVAPHIRFIDMAGHGYATLRLTSDAAECEFVCIPRPSEANDAKDGGPLRYRVAHRVPLWKAGEKPRLEQRVIEGDPELSL
jgi:alkaline phosphatase D